MSSLKEPIHGVPFADLLNELYAHAFPGAPGQSDEFTLPLLLREYIAYALAVYYQCEHCQHHHARAITQELKKQPGARWSWESYLLDVVLYTRIEKRNISDLEWERWQRDWRQFLERLGPSYAPVGHLVAFAIGTARNDEPLVRFEAADMLATCTDTHTMRGVLRDVIRVVAFMKAATTINRIIPMYGELVQQCAEKR